MILLLSAIPQLSDPELLVDLDATPRQLPVARLLAASDAGVLLVTRDGPIVSHDFRLRWVPVDSRGVDLGSVLETVTALRVGERFVVLDGPSASAITFDTGTAQRTQLAAANKPLFFVESERTTEAWFFDDDSLWHTDGTPQGTVSSARGFVLRAVEAERRIAGFADPSTVSVWDATGTALVQLPAQSLAAVDAQFVFGGGSLRNEAGDVLANGPCFALRGGWATCGSAIVSTDGTAAGTLTRDAGQFVVHASTPERLAYQEIGGAMRVVSRSGGPVTTLQGTCFDVGPGFRGPFLVCGHAVMPLDGGMTEVRASGRFDEAFFVGELVLHQQSEVLRSDGTLAGTRQASFDFGLTESVEPRLLSSNGVTALYASAKDAGVWLTDGTTAGTVRVGDRGLPWGTGALGLSADGVRAFDDRARPVSLPDGITGAANGWLVGREGCTAFRFDEQHARANLDTAGACVSALHVFDAAEAAFLELGNGNFLLVRSPFAPIPLGTAVDRTVAPRCGPKRCWFASPSMTGAVTLRSVELETRTARDEEPVVASGALTLLGASDDAVVATASDAQQFTFRIKRRGVPSFVQPIDPGGVAPSFDIASNSDVFFIHGSLLAVVGSNGQPTDFTPCANGRVQVDQARFWASCGPDDRFATAPRRLITGETGAPVELVSDAGAISDVVRDGEVSWFDVTALDAQHSELRIQSGVEQKVFPDLFASDFAPVRAGMVFAASSRGDRELWVVRYARAQQCGCSSADALFVSLLGLLARRRRR